MAWDSTKPLHDFTIAETLFPANVEEHAPKWDDIPEEFKGQSPWCAVARSMIFGNYDSAQHPMTLKRGIDGAKLDGHLQFLIATFALKHEHKEAVVAYLLSLCCELQERDSTEDDPDKQKRSTSKRGRRKPKNG